MPQTTSVRTGVRTVESVAEGLNAVLADTGGLIFKTHACHWNVEGPLFHAVHTLTEGQSAALFAAADDPAERIRAPGLMAPMRLDESMKNSVIEDPASIPSAGEICADLATDPDRVAHRLHARVKLAGEAHDPVTEALAAGRSAFHEKAARMLRSLARA